MAQNISVYNLVQVHNERVCFRAAAAKHYPDLGYCILFDVYPAAECSALVCRKVSEDTDYGKRACRLFHGAPGEKSLGTYVKVRICHSEQEAELVIESSVRGQVALQNAIGV